MSNGQEFEEQERERKLRRKVFYLTFATLAFLLRRISALETTDSHLTDHSRRLIGLFVPSGERSFSRPMVAARASSSVFLRSDWHCPVLRL